jgi:hypothetical protein
MGIGWHSKKEKTMKLDNSTQVDVAASTCSNISSILLFSNNSHKNSTNTRVSSESV